MGSSKVSGRKLYFGDNSSTNIISERRKQAIANSNNYLYIPNVNEKSFNFVKIKEKKHYDKKTKKSDYHTIFLTRHNESDRMKKERFIGKKKVRNNLKRELFNQIQEEIENE